MVDIAGADGADGADAEEDDDIFFGHDGMGVGASGGGHGVGSSGPGGGSGGFVVPDREMIKKHAMQIMNAKMKNKVVKKAKKKKNLSTGADD